MDLLQIKVKKTTFGSKHNDSQNFILNKYKKESCAHRAPVHKLQGTSALKRFKVASEFYAVMTITQFNTKSIAPNTNACKINRI